MKLFSIINTFDKKQLSNFLTYVELYHKPQSVICKVAQWLDKSNKWKTSKADEFTADSLYTELSFDIKVKTFSNALVTLGKLAEEYIGWMVWKDSLNLKRSCQLQGLAQKTLSDEYLKTQKEVVSETNSTVISVWDDFYKMRTYFNDYYFGFSSSENNYISEFKNLLESFRKSSAKIAQILLVEIKNRERLLDESWSQQSAFIDLFIETKTELKPITDNLISMNKDGSIASYKYLREILLSKEIDKFSLHIQYSIITYCNIFLTSLIKKGEIFRAQELLELYEFGFQKGILTLNGTMPIKKFINIINIASKLEKKKWARKIVDNWAYKVDVSNQKEIARFGHATIDFQEQKYENVVSILSRMKSTNFQHRFRYRWLLLMAQFELNSQYIDVVKVQVDNFRRFLISNESRINRPTFEGLKTSLKILNMILNRKPQYQMEEFYRNSKIVFQRRWIMEKIKNPT